MWKNFLYCKDTGRAKCKICQTVIKAPGSSTKGPIIHLKSKHQIEVKSCLEPASNDEPKVKVRKIDSFFKSDKQTLGEILCQLTAVDGLTFNQIATSVSLRRAFKSDGYDLPKSHKHVRTLVLQNFEKVKSLVKEELCQILKNDGRFSITFDESTSTRNRRYMNINAHFNGGFRSLGLPRVKGALDTLKAIDLVKTRLAAFGLDLDKDVVADITDGAAMMVKFGRETKPLHVICYAHAIHLAVCDVLYKKPEQKPSEMFLSDALTTEHNDEEEDEDVDDEEEEEGRRDNDNESAPDLAVGFHEVIKKVRKIAKIFRQSPVKNDDVLQPQNLANLGKEKSLLLDCKTRWNSLLDMLNRFYELRIEIKMALVQLDVPFDLTDRELSKVKELSDALAPFKVAVEALSSRDADLLLSEKVIAFTLKKLRELDSDVSKELTEKFETRINERRSSELIHLLKYLKNPAYLEQVEDQFGHKIKRPKIASLATGLLQRLYPKDAENEHSLSSEDVEVEVANTVEEQQEQLTLAQELYAFVEDDEAGIQNSDLSSKVVQKEMLLFEASKKRPENLEKLFQALCTIKPTSVEAERAFSAMGFFASKIRNRLNDDTLDALMFLRQYYKQQ